MNNIICKLSIDDDFSIDDKFIDLNIYNNDIVIGAKNIVPICKMVEAQAKT